MKCVRSQFPVDFIPLLEFGQLFQRGLRVKMMCEMIADVMWRQEKSADPSEMVVARGSHRRFRAAILIRFLHVFDKQAVHREIAGNYQRHNLIRRHPVWANRDQ